MDIITEWDITNTTEDIYMLPISLVLIIPFIFVKIVILQKRFCILSQVAVQCPLCVKKENKYDKFLTSL